MPKITTADDKLQGKGRSNIEKMKKTKKKNKKQRRVDVANCGSVDLIEDT